MDIEELSKSQIVLLVLLISFVTSMATGIVTVSLMNQEPTSVAQTVNRVIQQTIKEVSAPTQAASAAAPVHTTTVIKESDEISSAIQKSLPSIVRLYSSDGSAFLGLGVIIDKSGTIVTDIAAVGDASDASFKVNNGASIKAAVTTRDAGNALAFLSVATSSISTSTPAFVPIGLSAAQASLGETVILLAGTNSTWVGSGLVSSVVSGSDATPSLVKTNISGDNVIYGSPIIDTDGNLVGISTSVSRDVSGSAYLPVSVIESDGGQVGGVHGPVINIRYDCTTYSQYDFQTINTKIYGTIQQLHYKGEGSNPSRASARGRARPQPSIDIAPLGCSHHAGRVDGSSDARASRDRCRASH